MGLKRVAAWAGAAAVVALAAAVSFGAGWMVGSGRSAPAPAGEPMVSAPAAADVPPQAVSAPTVPAPTTTPAPIGRDASSLRLLNEAWDKVRESFVGAVPSDTVRNYAAIRGMLATLNDQYSIFVEPHPRAMERDQLRGQFGGIGATLRTDEQGRIALQPSRGSPAERAGVQPGDLLLAVDGVALPERPDVDQTVARVRGEPGTKVVITVLRTVGTEAKILDFTVTREVIHVPSVESRPITQTAAGPVVGYVSIRQFTERTAGELKTALSELKAQGAGAFVLDLRDNGGGLLNSAVDVASQFIEQGVIVQERRRGDRTSSLSATGSGLATRERMVVLVNGSTASASEIVAGALRETDRAKLVGEKTYGKGSVQFVYDLSDGSSVHVTAARWFTPKGNTIDGVGLLPDFPVSRGENEPARGVDSQLDKALEVLRESR